MNHNNNNNNNNHNHIISIERREEYGYADGDYGDGYMEMEIKE